MVEFSGGIITFWRSHLGLVTPIAASRNVIHLVISTGNLYSWILSVVYNSTRIQDQHLTWAELSGMSSLNLPWVLGDFNSMTDPS